MAGTSNGWLLLAATLPGRDATSARVRLWRSLRDLGAANVRDGVTLVPASGETGSRFAKIAEDIEADGGAAWVFALPPQESILEAKLRSLFDRSQNSDCRDALADRSDGELRVEVDGSASLKIREAESLPPNGRAPMHEHDRQSRNILTCHCFRNRARQRRNDGCNVARLRSRLRLWRTNWRRIRARRPARTNTEHRRDRQRVGEECSAGKQHRLLGTPVFNHHSKRHSRYGARNLLTRPRLQLASSNFINAEYSIGLTRW